MSAESQEILPPVAIPDSYNYIGVFLTFRCGLGCGYCINRFGELARPKDELTAGQWLKGLGRIITRPDLPLTLQGGEPTLHRGFYEIADGLPPSLNLDLLTNLDFDVDQFMGRVSPGRMKRQAPYASIRVSYHPEMMKVEELADKVVAMMGRGYSVGVWAVLHPGWEEEIARASCYCAERGIDFRTKEFLGWHGGRLYGTLAYPGACEGESGKTVRCKTTEFLIGPGGDVYRCHADLYAARDAIGHILDPSFQIFPAFRECGNYGTCNPCDVKVKTNRFQIDGHTSVEILF